MVTEPTPKGVPNDGADSTNILDYALQNPQGTPPSNEGIKPNEDTAKVEYSADDVAKITDSFTEPVKVDDKGNIINAKGEILKKAEEVKDVIANYKPKDTQVEKVLLKIGKDATAQEYLVDKNGNAIDAEGKIVATKDQLDKARGGSSNEGSNNSNSNETPLINDIIKGVGYEVLDETGKPKEYPDTLEGISTYLKDAVSTQLENVHTKIFNQVPRVKEFYNHIANGGSEEEFFSNPVNKDWSKVTLNKEDKTQQFNILVESLVVSGLSKEKAIKYAKQTQDSSADELYNESQEGLVNLKKKQSELSAARDQAITQELATRKAKEEKYWNSIEEVILKKGKIDIKEGDNVITSLAIPEKDKEEFFKYYSMAVENGLSQEMIDRTREDVETKLGYAYLRYKKFNIGDLAKTVAANIRVNELRERILNKRELVIEETPQYGSTKTNLDSITLENVLQIK